MSKETNSLVPTSIQSVVCHMCGNPMKRIKWEITAAAFDAGKEVEQTVYQCPKEEAFMAIEVSTGNPSKFAAPALDWQNPEF